MRKILSLVLGLMWVLPVWGALPTGYTKLEYIESTGTQYIDTGYKFSAGNKFEVVLNPLNNIQQGWFFGANSSGGEVLFSNGSIYFGASFRPSTASTSGLFPTTNTIYKITGDMRGASSNQSSLLIDDNLIWQGTGTFNDRKIYLFAMISSATDESSLARQKIRIYGFKIWQNDTIVQDLIPVKRHSDGVICMYDMVTGEFFENSGSGEFVAGPVAEIKIATTKYNETAFSPLNTALQNAISVVDTVVSNTITQAASIATLQAQKQTRPNDIADDNEKCPTGKKCLLVEDASGTPHWYEIVERYSLLPDGYTELEYIESTGTQYIDTGIKSASTIKAEFVVDRPISPASGSVWVPMGTTLDNNGQFSIFESTNGSGDKYVALTYGVVNGSTVDASAGDTAFAQSKFVLDGGVLTIDNGAKTITPPQAGTTFSTQNDIWLFLRPNTNVGVGVKMYYCKLWDNGVLVRDFVPAKNADGKIGMYDLANGVFYENAGEGSFIAGDPVVE